MPPCAFVTDLTTDIRNAATPGRAEKEKAYLKSELEHLGASVPSVRRAVRERSRASLPREYLATRAAADELWASGVHELRLAALELWSDRADLLTPGDLPYLEQLARESHTWALIDVIAPEVLGHLLVRHPEVEATLRVWSTDPDFWVRRAALLSYLKPLRRGDVPFHDFLALADPLLEDREFFVRKAIGWVLREHGRRAPDEVYRWLLPRRQRAARLTLREAAKYLPEEQRRALLEA